MTLHDVDTHTLARWWNILSVWDWPDDLPGQPDNWQHMPRFWPAAHPRPCRDDYVSPLLNYIEAKIGLKECLRYHHMHNLDRSHIEFELWWVFRMSPSFGKMQYNRRRLTGI